MMPEICKAPHLPVPCFHLSFCTVLKWWDAFITFPFNGFLSPVRSSTICCPLPSHFLPAGHNANTDRTHVVLSSARLYKQLLSLYTGQTFRNIFSLFGTRTSISPDISTPNSRIEGRCPHPATGPTLSATIIRSQPSGAPPPPLHTSYEISRNCVSTPSEAKIYRQHAEVLKINNIQHRTIIQLTDTQCLPAVTPASVPASRRSDVIHHCLPQSVHHTHLQPDAVSHH